MMWTTHHAIAGVHMHVVEEFMLSVESCAAIRGRERRGAIGVMRLIAVIGVVLFACGAFGCTTSDAPAVVTATSADLKFENDVRRVAALLDYVASDYAAAMTGGDPTEYKEQVAFVRDAADRAANLPALVGDASTRLHDAIAAVTRLVAQRASAVDVAAACRQARDALLAAYPVRLTPQQPPSRSAAASTFATTCATCHGPQGGGDGPAAAGLRPPPRSFRDPDTMLGLSPVRAFAAVTDGVPGTAMPSFGSALRERDRWSLAFYVMSLRFDGANTIDEQTASRLTRLKGLDRLALSSDRELVDAVAATPIPEPQRQAALAFLRSAAPFVEPSESLETMRRGLTEARTAYARGDRDAARAAVDDAYLDGFEPLEGRLRVSAPDLVAAVEEQALGLRESIARGEPVATFDADVDALDVRLDAVDARLSGGSSGATIFVASLVVILREGIESFLLIALLLGLASRAGGPTDRRAVHAGWIVALGAGVVTWLASGIVEGIGGGNRELLEGVVALLAVVVLLYAGHFVLARVDAQRRIAALKRRFTQVSARRRFAILFSLGFVALYREAFEVVLFLRAIALGATDTGAPLAMGVTAGVALCVIALVLMRRFGRRLPPGMILNIGGGLLCLLAVVLAGKGVRSLQEAGTLGVRAISGAPRIDWLGIYPTRETIIAQVAAVVAILVVAALGTRGSKPQVVNPTP